MTGHLNVFFLAFCMLSFVDLFFKINIFKNMFSCSMNILNVSNNLNPDQGPKLQCLLKVKEDLSLVLIFQHAILNAK